MKVLLLTEKVLFVGIEGVDWNYYVSCEIYWRKWVELSRN